jgi:hypothetical protein
MLGVAVAALIPLCLTGNAPARTSVHARVKCVGLYCAIVPEPERRPAPRPAAWAAGGAKRVPGGHVGKPRRRAPCVADR